MTSFHGKPLVSPKKMLFLQDFNLFLQNAPKMTYASEFSSFFRSFWYIWESWAMMSSSWKIRKTIKFFCTLSDSDTKFWSTRKSAGSNPTLGNMIFFLIFFLFFIMFRANLANISLKQNQLLHYEVSSIQTLVKMLLNLCWKK